MAPGGTDRGGGGGHLRRRRATLAHLAGRRRDREQWRARPPPGTVAGSRGLRPAAGAVRRRPGCLSGGREPDAVPQCAAVAAKGGTLAEITIGDVLELLDAEADAPQGHERHRRLLPDAAPDGHLRRSSAGDAAPAARHRAAEPPGADRPLPPRLRPDARPPGGLPAGAPTRPRLHQLGVPRQLPGQAVLAGHRAPPPRHRQPAPTRRRRRRLEAAPADDAQDDQDRDRREDRGRRPTGQLPGVPDPRAGLLPGPGAVGGGGPGALGPVGGALSCRRGRDQPAQIQTAAQVTHGRPHPRTASGPPRPRARRRPAAQGGGGSVRGRPPGSAR